MAEGPEDEDIRSKTNVKAQQRMSEFEARLLRQTRRLESMENPMWKLTPLRCRGLSFWKQKGKNIG